MDQSFIEGTRIPVTKISAGPCVVTQIKSKEKDGYWAIQVGFGTRNIKHIAKPQQAHLRGVTKEKEAPRFLREIRFLKKPLVKVGDVISVSEVFKRGDEVSVTGISKGKGFAGVVKRWKFAGGPKTHGQSDRQRAPGSIGQGTTPGRVWKGKKMAGRMGGEQATVKNLIVVDVNNDESTILVSGPVPGNKNGLLRIRKTGSGKLKELVQEVQAPQIQEEVEEKVQEDVVSQEGGKNES